MAPPTPRSALAGAIALVAALSAGRSAAQVNVETLRSDIDRRTGYVALQASYAGHSGNVSGSVGSGAAFAGINVGRHLAFVKVQGDYAQFNGKATLSKAFAHARYDLRVLPFLQAEVFIQFEENKFQRLALRQLDGLGARFTVVQREIVELYFGTAWMLDYAKLNDAGVFAPFTGASWFAQRWSNYLSVGVRVGARARFSDTLYVQPRFNGFHDVRLLNDASFAIDIDKRFSAKISSQVHHNSTPPVGVKPTDVDTLTSLVLTF